MSSSAMLQREHRRDVPEAGQLADVRVGDVLRDVLLRVGEERGGLLPPQEQDRHGDLPEHLGSVDRGPS